VHAFTDPGERAALLLVGDRVRDKPILDLGVGTGRTVPLLSPLTHDYRAIDFVPAMVEATRAKHPQLNVAEGDARNLSGCPSGHFALVYFSFNGIDAVSAADRRLVFRSVRRVLAPGGYFVFSTLNIDGPSYRERPWRVRFWPTRNPLVHAARIGRLLIDAPTDLANWRRLQGSCESGPGWAVAPLSAHHYGILAHYTTLARQLDELQEEGFARDCPVFESVRGARVSPADDTSHADWFTLVTWRV
jgi:SAM-dependent methyltransferase